MLTLFERLNARLRADLGPQGQVGHSYFMVPDLDEARLRMVWQHHVRPLLDEHFAGQPGRAAAYEIDPLLAGEPHRENRRRRLARAAADESVRLQLPAVRCGGAKRYTSTWFTW